MNFEFTSEQLAAAKSFADAVRERIACDAERQDADPGVSEQIIRAHMKTLGALGWHGLTHDAAIGGAGMTHLEWTLYAEALGGLAPTTFLSATSAAGATVRPIAKFGTAAQVERFVRPALGGEAIGAFAVTEAESGSDPLAVKLAATRDGDGWVLDGEKVWATNGPICDFALVLAATKPEGGPNGLSLFVIPADAPGFERGARVATMGHRGALVGPIRLNRCRVGADALVGPENAGFGMAMHAMQFGRLSACCGAIGLGETAMALSLGHALTRRAAGTKIIKHQEVAFKLSQMKMLTDTGRLITQYAAWCIDTGSAEASAMVSAAKIHTTEAATKIANFAMQIFAGAGYTAGHPIERLYRDAKLGELLFGTTEVHRVMLAQDTIARFGDVG